MSRGLIAYSIDFTGTDAAHLAASELLQHRAEGANSLRMRHEASWAEAYGMVSGDNMAGGGKLMNLMVYNDVHGSVYIFSND